MSLDVLDWRRETFALYRAVRAAPDPASGHALWCERRQRLVSTHPASPNRASRLHHAPYDAAFRFEVEVEVDVEPQRLEIATGTDGVVPFERIGRVDLSGIGSLDLWWLESYGGGIWLPIRDGSTSTYGGGRYVLDTVKGADLGGGGRRLTIDLNFAYNPSCAYAEEWACPLAPPGNVVEADIPVGELLPD
ncbi:MAG: DUF1684 domain-containing protein [Frankiaceae bacterium]|nr:DUF1684 domain-containing protein [Frankiaceae bacterium]MBV9872139.1 DUF1684 domain-containing protein [Frankiaceae bacterium]